MRLISRCAGLGPVNTVSGEMAIIHGGREVEDFALVNLRLESGAIAEVYTAYTDRQPEEMRAQLQGMRGKLEFCLNPYLPERNGVWLNKKAASSALRCDSLPRLIRSIRVCWIVRGLRSSTWSIICWLVSRPPSMDAPGAGPSRSCWPLTNRNAAGPRSHCR